MSFARTCYKAITPEAFGHLVASALIAFAAKSLPWEGVVTGLTETVELSRASMVAFLAMVGIFVALTLTLVFWRKYWVPITAKLRAVEVALQAEKARSKALGGLLTVRDEELAEAQAHARKLESVIARR